MLLSVWKSKWTQWWGGVQVAVGASIPIIHSVVSNDDVKNALLNLHLGPRAGLVLAVLGAITLVSMEH